MYCLSATPDSMAPYLKATIDFAKRQPSSSRCNALLAYAYNCRAVNLHNFHKDPDEVIRLYHRADSLLGRVICRVSAHWCVPIWLTPISSRTAS